MKYLSICKINFIFLIIMRLFMFFISFIFIIKDNVIFIEWELISINSIRIVITLLFDWISLIFISFVLIISSLVIYYRKEYIIEDYKINRFII